MCNLCASRDTLAVMSHFRADVAQVTRAEKTPQGGLKVPAYLTRIGVFEYVYDGKKVRELRHPNEVFSKASLNSLRSAPVTIGHPGVVTPKTWKAMAVGHVAEDVHADGKFVASAILVQDERAVSGVESKELVELSCGYTCDVVEGKGTYDGQEYDAVQTNIRYNHVGLGGKGWGRAGSEVSVRLDGQEGDETHYLTPCMETILKSDHDKALADVAEKLAESQKRADAAELQIKELTGKVETLEKAATPEAIQARVDARVSLVSDCSKVLGTVDASKADEALMAEVVAKVFPTLKCDGPDLKGLFLGAVASFKPAPDASLGKIREDANGASEAEDPITAAQKAMIAKNATLYKGNSK